MRSRARRRRRSPIRRALDAQIAEAKNRAEIAAAKFGYTKITAPIEGDVIDVLTQEGQTVVATQIAPVILDLARLDAMTIRTQLSEADVIHIAVGHPVSFIMMGDPDTRYGGTLRAVKPAPKQPSSC